MRNFSIQQEHGLFSWLANVLDPSQYDVVVTVERKATALIRAFIDLSPDYECKVDWSHVLSSEALKYLPENWLKGKRVLVFNEMVHLGSSTKDTIEAIFKNTPPDLMGPIETAALYVHQEFANSNVLRTIDYFRDRFESPVPMRVLQRDVSEEMYKLNRDRLIQLLKSRGALLLDTEHIESTFNFTIAPRRFLEALTTFGNPVEYENDADGNFPGITIRTPVTADMEELRATLPEGADLSAKAPQKVRVVRRGPKSFAFVPIWYPPISLQSETEPPEWLSAPAYAKRAIDECPKELRADLIFHLVSLVTGIDLLRNVWGGLAPYLKEGIDPDYPSGLLQRKAPLGHLHALYPLLDFDELQRAMRGAISACKDRDLTRRVHKESEWSGKASVASMWTPTSIDARTNISNCRAVLGEVARSQIESTTIDPWNVNQESHNYFPPLPWNAFWDKGEALGIPESERSVVMDIAIDNAVLKTTQIRIRRRSVTFMVRAFEPDSEYARDEIIRLGMGAEELV